MARKSAVKREVHREEEYAEHHAPTNFIHDNPGTGHLLHGHGHTHHAMRRGPF